MFSKESEMSLATRIGSLEVEWGSMFSGKSDALITAVKRAMIANKKIQAFKPQIDNRYSDDTIVTHDGKEIPCVVVKDSYDLMSRIDLNTEIVAIDEVQFFDDHIIEVINSLRRYGGTKVVVAGLDMWANGEPVELTSKLAAIAHKATKHHAVCVDTGEEAYLSYCLVEKEGDVLVGGNDKYIALSEKAYLERMKK